MLRNIFFFLSISLVLCFFTVGCKKEMFNTDASANITFSKDTIKFDTVFVATGSITQSFKFYNNNDEKIKFSQIKLMGGNASPFQININGISSNQQSNYTLNERDSAYVFITVNVNPLNQNLPFILQDSIRFDYNGVSKFVQLEAYGQQARFIENATITENTFWNDSLPYLIRGPLTIDSNVTLQINSGCKIYLHANAPILVDGTLKVNGTKASPVVFRGDRLDEYYKDLPGSWPGIYFRKSSVNNQLKFAKILNATESIYAIQPANNSNPKIIIQQSEIDNALQTGIFAYESSFVLENTLISNCKKNMVIEKGGTYQIEHCTIVAYSNPFIIHQHPVVEASDFSFFSSSNLTSDLDLFIKNSIIWGEGGTNNNEINLSKQGNGLFRVIMENSILRAETDPANLTSNQVIRNIDPLFDSIDTYEQYYNFRTSTNPSAPGINQGAATNLSTDLDGNSRVVNGSPDIGCYEKQ